MNIIDILKAHESKVLEFKENIKPKDKLLSTIIAFANLITQYPKLHSNDVLTTRLPMMFG